MRSGEARWPEGALLFVALALFAVGFGWSRSQARAYAPGAREPSGLRIVTWNVGGYRGAEGVSMDDEQLAHVATQLRALNPDLAFLQEVSSREQARALGERLGPAWTLLAGTRRSGRRVVALAQRGTLAPLERRARDRGRCAVTYVTDRWNVAAVGLHADAYSARERNRQVGAAVDLLVGAEASVHVLAGDLNLDLDLGKRRDLFSDDEHLDVETYNYVTLRLVDAASGTGSTAEPDRRLDYVFVAGDDVQIKGAGPVRDRRAGDMDHDPVVLDLAGP